MSRRDINIGVEGNDGTGDSIRESFRKTNENFEELYAIFGQGGQISFSNLDDTPDALIANTIPLVNDAGDLLQLVTLGSDSDLDPAQTDTITFTTSQAGKLIITTAFNSIADEDAPKLNNPLNAGGKGIANVAVSNAAATEWNDKHNLPTDPTITIDDLVITKGYADNRYISSGLPIRVQGEPADTSAYIKTIELYVDGNLQITGHGYDSSINGTPFIFTTIYTDPNALTSGETYFARYVTDDEISLHSTREGASSQDPTEALSTKISITHTIEQDDIHRITDAGLDASLEGNFLGDVAVPRKSVVRRQGDTMAGALTLADHPGDLAGFGVVNGSDDLQAATKFYVDNSAYSSIQNIFVSTGGDDRMVGVPPGREGTALEYAYRTINAAADRAYELIRTSEAEPGPYFQTVTRDSGSTDAEVTVRGVVNPINTDAKSILDANREFLQKEVTGYIAFTFPDFIYDILDLENDIGLILDAVAFDITRATTANFLTRRIAERYYSTISGRQKITTTLTQTIAAVDIVQDIVDVILQNKLLRQKDIEDSGIQKGTRTRVVTQTDHGFVDGEQIKFDENVGGIPGIRGETAYIKVIDTETIELYTDSDLINLYDSSGFAGNHTTGGAIGIVYQTKLEQDLSNPAVGTSPRTSASELFDTIKTIIQEGPDEGDSVVFGNSYQLTLNNGNRSFVDQGDPENTDLLPGKVIVGDRSGAKGRIITLINNDPVNSNNDTLTMIMLNAKDFEIGESVRYGNFVNEKQITLFVESGIYEEDFPIRLSNNVSLKGDEFRRVIIRPKNRVSQSDIANTYFYRDEEFDGNRLVTKQHDTITEASTDTLLVFATTQNVSAGSTVTQGGTSGVVAEASINEIIRVTSVSGGPFGTSSVVSIDGNPSGTPTTVYTDFFEANDTSFIADNLHVKLNGTALGGLDTTYRYIVKDAIDDTRFTLADRQTVQLPITVTLTNGDTVAQGDVTGEIIGNFSGTDTITIGNLEGGVITTERSITIDGIDYGVPLDITTGTQLSVSDETGSLFIIKGEASPFFNQVGDIQGYFGFHYLTDINNPVNRGNTITNPGNYNIAAGIMRLNKNWLQEEVIDWINDNVQTANDAGNTSSIWYNFSYNATKCQRDIGLIVDAITQDFENGGEELVLEAQGEYYEGSVTGQEAQTTAAINYLGSISAQLLQGSAPTPTESGDFTPDISLGAGETKIIGQTPLGVDIQQTAAELVGDFIAKIVYAFDTDYNSPKRNDQMDMFLMADATIIRNVTCQGHGGFMCVLDPAGQILTKSPYIQTASSFSKSINAKTFAGGMFVDAFCGNIPVSVTGKNSAYELTLQSEPGQGLRIRPPELPCPFYVEGRRYQVNAIANYDQGNGTVTVILDPDSNNGDGYDETQFSNGQVQRDIFLQTAGNRSILGNDYTQINDLGYGLVVGNGAFSEMVSMFTYYTHVAYYAFNGAEIRSLNGSNGYGNFGLVAEGADPNEIPDQVTLRDNMVQPVKAYTDTTFTNATGDSFITITDAKTVPSTSSQLTVDHGAAVGILTYSINAVQLLSGVTVSGIRNVTSIGAANGARTQGTYTGVSTSTQTGSGTGAEFTVEVDGTGAATITVTTPGSGYQSGDSLTIADSDLGGGGAPNLTFDVDTVYGGAMGPGNYSNAVYRLAIRADDVISDDFFGTIQDTIANGTMLEFRNNFTHIFDNVISPDELTERPSTAINFDESDDTTYRSIDFSEFDIAGTPLASDEVQSTFEIGFEFENITIDISALSNTDPDDGAKTLGATAGDTKLAILPLTNLGRSITQLSGALTDASRSAGVYTSVTQTSTTGLGTGAVFNVTVTASGSTTIAIVNGGTNYAIGDTITIADSDVGSGGAANIVVTVDAIFTGLSGAARLQRDVAGRLPGDVGYSGGMIFVFDGKTHQITGYDDSGAVPYIEFQDYASTNINPSPEASGLNSGVPARERSIPCGLPDGATAEITIAISLCRATGHDFTQIGTGGFNSSNYPNVILGQPESGLAQAYTNSESATKSQVWERRKGRVFFATTDQFGFFRVGKFFSVDQATGDINFAGDVGITSANQLGFKKGVVINEFSPDDNLDRSGSEAVPTEAAIASYIDRRLGYNDSNQIQPQPTGNRIGPGFLALNGDTEMEGNIDMGNFVVTNLGLPGTDGSAATNKNYVDEKVQTFDEFGALREIDLQNATGNDFIMVSGAFRLLCEPGSAPGFNVGENIIGDSSFAEGKILDVQTPTDPILGPVNIISYTAINGTFTDGDQIEGQTTGAIAEVYEGPFQEIMVVSEDNDSDIEITITRDTNGATLDLQIADDTIFNSDVNSNAAIAQSKLNMQSATTFTNNTSGSGGGGAFVQSNLGLTAFKTSEFTVTGGFAELKTASSGSTGVGLGKISHIATDTVLGRSAAGTGAVSAVAFDTVLDQGGALEDRDFNDSEITLDIGHVIIMTALGSVIDGELITSSAGGTGTVQGTTTNNATIILVNVSGTFAVGNTLSGTISGAINGTIDTVDTNEDIRGFALVKQASGVYGTTQITHSSAGNTIPRRSSTGALQAESYQMGGANTVLTDSGGTTTFSNQNGATILTATGSSGDASIRMGKRVVIGSDLATTTADESSFQAASPGGSANNSNEDSGLAATWIYTRFIEAIGEKGTSSTGIGIGADIGFNQIGSANVIPADYITFVVNGDVAGHFDSSKNLTVDGNVIANGTLTLNTSTASAIVYEGTANASETRLSFTDPTADRTITFPDASGTVIVSVSDTSTTTQSALDLDLTLSAAGNLSITGSAEGLATTDSPTFAGITLNGTADVRNITAQSNNTYSIGANGTRFNTVYAVTFDGTATTATYADLAENYLADDNYEPGTVMVFGGKTELTTATAMADNRVAGVVSENPAYLMNSDLVGEYVIALALQGRVPCKVVGKVNKGDMLVTSSIPGHAIKSSDPKVGTVIGKALENKETPDRGVIEIVVGKV